MNPCRQFTVQPLIHYWLLSLLLVCGNLLPGAIDIYGYYETQGDYSILPEAEVYFGYHKLRLDLFAEPGDNIRVGADVIARVYNGNTVLNLWDWLPTRYRDQFSGDNPELYQENLNWVFADTLLLDNMVLDIFLDWADFSLGRQPISPGVGYAWNPTDIFNRKDPMDPTYEQMGVNAMKAEFPLPGALLATAILQPENNWSETPRYLQLKRQLQRFEISVVAAQGPYEETGWFSSNRWQRDMAGINLVGEIIGMGVHLEAAAHRFGNDSDSIQVEFLVGGDYTFSNGLYCITEYLHNDLGRHSDETTLDDVFITLNGHRHSLNRDYGFANLLYPLRDVLDCGFLTVANFSDGSGLFMPQFIYRPLADLEILTQISLFWGSTNSEYGHQEGALRVRLNAYF